MYFLGVIEKLTASVKNLFMSGIKTIFYALSTIIYRLVIDLYNMFDSLCTARLLDNEILSELSERIGLILGLVMLFFVIFAFIQMLLDPDKINDKTNGAVAVVKRTLIVIILLGVSNFAFQALYSIQKILIESNVISNLLLPYSVETTDESGKDQFGSILASELLLSFYQMENLDDESVNSLDSDSKSTISRCEENVDILRSQIVNDYNFNLGYSCLNETVAVENGTEEENVNIINFNWLLSPIVGLVVAYLLLIYCLQVGLRMVQLMFLEIISPMAFVSYLSPKKDTMFGKWVKIYFSTYIDIFIRVAIINFVVFLCATVLTSINNDGFIFWDTVGNPANFYTKSFYKVVIIIALLSFAKKAPELLKDLFPGGAAKLGLGLSTKELFGLGAVAAGTTAAGVGIVGRAPGIIRDFKDANGVTGKAKALIFGGGALVAGGVGGALRGSMSGAGKGVGGAIKAGQQAQAKANLARAQRIASGKGTFEYVTDAASAAVGMPSGYEKYNQDLAMSNAIKDTLGNEDVIKHIREVRQSYIQSCAANGTIAEAAKLSKYDEVEKEAMRQMYAFAHDNSSGSSQIQIVDTELGLSIDEEYKTNLGIHNQIKNNEKRVGRTLATYDKWKEDNNSIKNKIARKTKGSGK